MRVAGKTIMITGAAGGIGSAAARLLCREGAVAVLLDLDEPGGAKLKEEICDAGGKALFLAVDITTEAGWAEAVRYALDETGRIDVLVNNAGINIRKPIEEMHIDEWQMMMKVNTGSVFLGTKYCLPVMRKQGSGSVINMSSICGLVGHKFTPEAYTATKGAVTLLTKSVAARYASDGIRSNSIHPSTVDTPFIKELFKDPQRKQERLGEVPLGRLATVEDVAQAVLFLASDESSFITGVSLPVDGGLTAY